MQATLSVQSEGEREGERRGAWTDGWMEREWDWGVVGGGGVRGSKHL